MTARFWRSIVRGASCTHGETFYPDEREIVWWAKGGRLRGESPARIAFLRKITEEIPGPLTPESGMGEEFAGRTKEEVEELLAGRSVIERSVIHALVRADDDYLSHMRQCEGECMGHAGERAYLWYLDLCTYCKKEIRLPEEHSYRVEVLDTWEMTRTTAAERASGTLTVSLPAKPWMAIFARAVD